MRAVCNWFEIGPFFLMEDVNREGWNNGGFDDVGCEKIECWTKFELVL